MSREHYLGELQTLADSVPEAVSHLRKRALDVFASLSFPTTREEDWRFTNVSPATKIPFHNTALEPAAKVSTQDILPYLADAAGWRIVFVDGRYSETLSNLPREFVAGNLFHADKGDSVLQQFLGALVPADHNAFTAWNTASLQDLAFLRIPSGFQGLSPVYVLFVSTASEDAVSFPRTLALLDKGSQATLVESYVTLDEGRVLTNAVTEVVLGEGAVLQHVKLQQESSRGYHIASTHVSQGRDSSYTSLSVTLGSGLSRDDLCVTLAGPGGDCTLNGLYLIGGEQHTDHHTTIDHATPHGTSRELYKGILDGKGRAIFNGRIIVRKDAQKTDAEQTNRNLLLSPAARVNSIPQLEILADDVKCRHGATIGHLDEDAMFYLQARGISEASARRMLMQSFVREVTDRITTERVRESVEHMVLSRLLEFTGGVA